MRKYLVLSSITLATVAVFLFNSCKSIPQGVTAVKLFDTNKYLGKWYEIARLDYKYERNLNNVTADYSLKENGKIKVDNKGYNFKKKEWQESIGKAKYAGDKDEAKLLVSFFGPFYAGYNVIAIDKDYKYALVAGSSVKNLWILSRETSIPENIKLNYLQKAKEIGYATDDLVWVEHDKK